MARFPFELALPLCLVLLQVLWSYLYPLLAEERVFHAEHSPKPEAKLPATSPQANKAEQARAPSAPNEAVFAEKWVHWLTPSGENRHVQQPAGAPGSTTELPLFPLSAAFYALNSRPTLQIFEPRYRQLYKDALSSGQNSFVVTAADPDTGHLAAYGVVLHIDRVADVADKTDGQIKYVAEHTVKSRVQIHRVLNPDQMADQQTYLRVAAAPVEDDPGDAEDVHDLEVEVADIFTSIVKDVGELHAEIQARGLHVNASREGGLWQLAALWLDSYARHRVRAIQQQLLSQMKEVYEQYASESMQEQLNPEGMPQSVQAEVRELKVTFDAEIQRTVEEQVNLGQLLLQSRSHKERLHLLRSALQVERLFAAAADPETMAAAFAG